MSSELMLPSSKSFFDLSWTEVSSRLVLLLPLHQPRPCSPDLFSRARMGKLTSGHCRFDPGQVKRCNIPKHLVTILLFCFFGLPGVSSAEKEGESCLESER